MTTLLLGFALVGVVLSIVGVYGVLAQTSRNRTREMGIRIALGAQSTQVRWLVVSQGLRLTAVGLVAGSAVAIVATRAMASLLFNMTPNRSGHVGGRGATVGGDERRCRVDSGDERESRRSRRGSAIRLTRATKPAVRGRRAGRSSRETVAPRR